MAKWNELGFGSEPVPVDVSDLPEQPGASFAPIPQPGDYSFALPAQDVLAEAWDFQLDEKGARHPILMLAQPKQGEAGPDARLSMDDGQKVRTRLSGQPRDFNGKMASDLHFLVSGAFKHSAPIVGGLGLVQAVLLYAGQRFKSYFGWSTRCNPANDIYGADSQIVTGKKGCGRRYGERAYTKKNGEKVLEIPKVDGKFVERFECVCGAHLRAFGNLNNFRSVE
jgi:hypothetical protein